MAKDTKQQQTKADASDGVPKPNTTDEFWRAIREEKRKADQVGRPSVMKSFQDWARLENEPTSSSSAPVETQPMKPKRRRRSKK